jgi:tetratricopeptide (TPR) repeat protein
MMEETDMQRRSTILMLLAMVLFLLLPRVDAVAQEQSVPERVQAYLADGKYAEARPLIESELENNTELSDNARANLFFQLAYALLELKEYRGSINCWHAVLAMAPKHPILWGNVGWAYYLHGDIDSAIIATDNSLGFDGTQAWVWGNMGLYRLAKGDIDGMRAAYAKLPAYTKDMDAWSAIRLDYETYCIDPSRPGCKEAGEALQDAWTKLLLRWYAEGDADTGVQLVRDNPKEFKKLRQMLEEKIASAEETERETLTALRERLVKDMK